MQELLASIAQTDALAKILNHPNPIRMNCCLEKLLTWLSIQRLNVIPLSPIDLLFELFADLVGGSAHNKAPRFSAKAALDVFTDFLIGIPIVAYRAVGG